MKKKKVNCIFISNANGGIATFQSNLINYLHYKKIKTYFFDKKKNQTLVNINNIKKIDFFHSNVLKEIKLTINNLLKIKNSSITNVFIISNPVILLFYFLPIKFFFRKNRIIFFHHSHIIKRDFNNYFVGYLIIILKIFIYKSVYVSKYTLRWWNGFSFLNKFLSSQIIPNTTEKVKVVRRKKNIINIGFVGRFDEEKGIDKFLSYIKHSNLNNLNFKLFGDGPLKNLIPKNSSNIFYWNWSSKNKIYSNIDILFVTSKLENCPFTVLEAKSVGIPTVTISEGGISEIIKHKFDGIILKKNANISQISRAFKEIICNYKKYKKNCLINSKKFEFKKQEKILKLFF
tara:strand:+ start:1002 stop:2036 length:1035 start_codon:yes stop_codon:yes gene_type:complete